jgi:hypothetical protein
MEQMPLFKKKKSINKKIKKSIDLKSNKYCLIYQGEMGCEHRIFEITKKA